MFGNKACSSSVNKSTRGPKRTKALVRSSTSEPSALGPNLFSKIPPEIFIHICRFLPPERLFSLSAVCKLFYEYLYAVTPSTELIWREAREQLYPEIKILPAPPKMSERQYTLLIGIRGCQFCDRKSGAFITWAFGIRACPSCTNSRRVTAEDLRKKYQIPREVIDVLPLRALTEELYYLPMAKDMAKAYHEQQDKEAWLDEKAKECEAIMKDSRLPERAKLEATIRNTLALRSRNVRDNRCMIIDAKLQEMVNRELDGHGNPIYDIRRLKKCPSYRKARSYRTAFTDRSWNLLRKKLFAEYEFFEDDFGYDRMNDNVSDEDDDSISNGLEGSDSE